MKRRAVIEDAIGETRAALYEGRKLAEFHLRRHVGPQFPRAGDIYTGRIIAVDPSVAGAFVDLGEGQAGLLKFASRKDLPKLTEGLLLDVIIARAAIRSASNAKGPNVHYHAEASRETVGVVKSLSLRESLEQQYPGITFEDSTVSALDDGAEIRLALKGGGSVTFEQTQALLAIDVDKGEAASPYECSVAAAYLIASQLRLRGLGGLVVIDFPNIRQTKQRNALVKTLLSAFDGDSAMVKVAPMSRFGCVEMTRSMSGPPLDMKLNGPDGQPSLETRALRALRRLEREGGVNGGAQLTLYAPQDILSWLETTDLEWRTILQDRIGARFKLELGEAVNVSADR